MANEASRELLRLLKLMRRLRGKKGCPWDREQNHATLLKCLIEETYELYDTVMAKDFDAMKEELGDLFLQTVFHCQMAEEKGKFDMGAVLKDLNDKLVRRHPHVFGEARAKSGEEGLKHWEKIKRSEKSYAHRTSVLDGVPLALPALSKAYKIQKKAAKSGFDWPGPRPVFAKLREELGELSVSVSRQNVREMRDEMGDLLFTCVNLARQLHLDPEEALAAANRKFSRRFRAVEKRAIKRGQMLEKLSPRALDRLWKEVKEKERR